MDVLAAARSRPNRIATALLAVLAAPAVARADGPPRTDAVAPGAPVPLYLQAAELAPAVLVEWAAPADSQATPVINIDDQQQQYQTQQQKQNGGGGSSSGGGGGGANHAPEPATLVSGVTGLLLSGLGLRFRRRRRVELEEAEAAEDEYEDAYEDEYEEAFEDEDEEAVTA